MPACWVVRLSEDIVFSGTASRQAREQALPSALPGLLDAVVRGVEPRVQFDVIEGPPTRPALELGNCGPAASGCDVILGPGGQELYWRTRTAAFASSVGRHA